MTNAFADATTVSLEGRRLVVIGASNGQANVFEQFARRHRDWNVIHAPTILSGIAEACRATVEVVVAAIPAASAEISQAVAGLREAAGERARVLLACRAEAEPAAREALKFGADDYLIAPVDVAELETAMGIDPQVEIELSNSGAGADEVAGIADLLSQPDARPGDLMRKLADLMRAAVNARGVTLSMPGAGASAGECVTRAVLSFPFEVGQSIEAPDGLTSTSATVDAKNGGRLIVGEKARGPYTPDDVQKLTQYARLAGRVLSAAHRQRRWRELAMTDTASGLPNRRSLLEQISPILERAASEQFAVTFLLFDVDDFKGFNDRHGHDAGDEILRIVGQLFRKTCREQDIVARYGGDEFAVVFWDPSGPREPGSRHPQQALSVLDRFTEALRNQKFSRLGPEGGRVTISGGLATYPWDATTVESLISRADEALLSAKRAGKNRVVVVGG